MVGVSRSRRFGRGRPPVPPGDPQHWTSGGAKWSPGRHCVGGSLQPNALSSPRGGPTSPVRVRFQGPLSRAMGSSGDWWERSEGERVADLSGERGRGSALFVSESGRNIRSGVRQLFGALVGRVALVWPGRSRARGKACIAQCPSSSPGGPATSAKSAAHQRADGVYHFGRSSAGGSPFPLMNIASFVPSSSSPTLLSPTSMLPRFSTAWSRRFSTCSRWPPWGS